MTRLEKKVITIDGEKKQIEYTNDKDHIVVYGRVLYVNGKLASNQAFFEEGLLDSNCNFTIEKDSDGHVFLKILDPQYDEYKKYVKCKNEYDINQLSFKVDHEKKINLFLLGIKTERISEIKKAFVFKHEVVFNNFSVAFDENNMVFFNSNHGGSWVIDLLYLNDKDNHDDFSMFLGWLKDKINTFYGLNQ